MGICLVSLHFNSVFYLMKLAAPIADFGDLQGYVKTTASKLTLDNQLRLIFSWQSSLYVVLPTQILGYII